MSDESGVNEIETLRKLLREKDNQIKTLSDALSHETNQKLEWINLSRDWEKQYFELKTQYFLLKEQHGKKDNPV